MTVDVSVDGGVMTLTLNRPDKKNALTGPMYQTKTEALRQAAADEAVKVVLIQAAGNDFSAGNDIGDFAKVAMIPAADRPQHAQDFLRALAAFEKPVVAAVQGVAVGIGLTMLLHCDLVVVADDARLSAPFGILGLTPEAGSSLLLPALIGHVRAFSVFTLGEVIMGETAVSLGLANVAVAAGEVQARARAAAGVIATRSPDAMKATKALMRRPAQTLDQIERELVEFEARLRSPEAKAAFAAFASRK